MSNIPNAPAMPSGIPTRADVARYNNWAARYGEPLWGAAVAPAPAPKAKAKAKSTKTTKQTKQDSESSSRTPTVSTTAPLPTITSSISELDQLSQKMDQDFKQLDLRISPRESKGTEADGASLRSETRRVKTPLPF